MRSSLTTAVYPAIAVYLATAVGAQASSFVTLGVATETPSVVALTESIVSVAEAEATPSIVAFAEPAQTIEAEPAIAVASEDPDHIEALPAIETAEIAPTKITADPQSMFAVLSPSVLVAGLESGQSYDLAALDIGPASRKTTLVMRAGVIGPAFPNTGSPDASAVLPAAEEPDTEQQAGREEPAPEFVPQQTEDATQQPGFGLPPAPKPQDAPAMPSLPFPSLAPGTRE